METLQGALHKPPAVIIIARHGARIDAVDKEWDLTSPAPYDPPLTYGGWLQGRALGVRIASLLKAREISVHDDALPSASSSNTTLNSTSTAETASEEFHQRPSKKVRKHKLIIHSSPYLRCVQTSVAISAGISQYYRTENEHPATQTPSESHPASADVSPLTSPPRSSTPTAPDQWGKHSAKDRINGHGKRTKTVAPKTRLRIDGFLGEWLTRDYFEQITPPPASVIMVAGAKAELQRRGEPLDRTHNSGSNSFAGHFPGGWKSNQSPTLPDSPNENGSFGMSPLVDALPVENRDNGFSYNRSNRPITIRDVLSRTPSHSYEEFSEGYIPPVPSYAISPSDPIPVGYFAHARDACVDVDYQWDSMKSPQNWGDGGEYGEEWSAMHKRFRSGLLKLLDWYSQGQPQRHHPNHHRHHHHHHHHHHGHGEDDGTDTVVVLVTHGTGCNALIGALMNQPVLIEMAMASLTMAVRKDIFRSKDSIHQSPADVNGGVPEPCPLPSSTPLNQIYDVSLVGSTEHLRAVSNPLSIPQLPSPILERSRSISVYRHREDSNTIKFDKTTQPARKSGLQRSATISSSPQHHRHHPAQHGLGLWSSATNTNIALPKENNERVIVEEDPNNRAAPAAADRPKLTPIQTIQTTKSTTGSKSHPGIDNPKPSSSSSSSTSASSSNQQPPDRLQEQPKSQFGLWSSSATIAQAREPPTRRRWTITEQHQH